MNRGITILKKEILMIKQVLPIQQQQNTIMSVDPILLPGNNPILCFLKWQDLRHKSFVVTMYNYLLCWKSKYIHVSRYMYSTILGKKHAYIQAQIIWSTRRLVKVLLGIQQKISTRRLVQKSLLDVQQSRRFGPLYFLMRYFFFL